MDGGGTHTETGKTTRGLNARAAPGAIFVTAAFLRFFALGRNSLWFDELYNVWSARFPLADQMAEGLAAGHPPLYYLIARLWFAMGESEVWVRALSGLSGLVLVWLMYLLGRELFSRQAGLWAAALAAVSPMLVWYSRAATFYSLLFSLTALSLLFLARATIRGGWKNWAAFVAAMTAVYLTSFFGAVLQLACFAAYWVLKGRQPRQAKTFLWIQVLLAAIALASWLISRFSVTEETFSFRMPPLSSYYLLVKRAVTAPLAILGGDPMQNISMGTNWFASWMVGAPARPLVLIAALLLALALATLLVKYGIRNFYSGNTAALLVVSLVLTLVTLFLVFISDEQLTSRFYAWAVPSTLGLIAGMIAGVPGRWRLPVGGAVIAIMLMLTIWGTWLFPQSQGYVSDVGGLLREGYRDNDLVYGFPLHEQTVIEAYYLPDAPPPLGGFPGFLGEMYFMPPGEVWSGYRSGYWIGTGKTPPVAGADLEARVVDDVRGASRVWLIVPAGFSGAYPEIEAVFDRELELRDRWSFPPVVVMLYSQ